MPDDRVVLKIPPELWEKVKEKTGTDGKVESIEALVTNNGNGHSIEQIPENLRQLGPDALQELVKLGAQLREKKALWDGVLLEARARKARADAIKAELEIQNLQIKNTNYSYGNKPLWCWQHEDFEGTDSPCFNGMSEGDKRISQNVATHKREQVRTYGEKAVLGK